MKVVILAGGLGTRLSEETTILPKPMVQIGGKPILWHIMKCYAHWGFNEFIVALGYKGEVIKNYFVNYRQMLSDLTVDLKSGTVTERATRQEDWIVHLIDTGAETLTGGRLRRLESMLANETFMLTYGDGVIDVDLRTVLAFHRAQGKLATLTAVRPPARFGNIAFNEDETVGFAEKRQTDAGWINGGFMVLEPGVFRYLRRDADVLEVDLLERLANDRELVAYRHEGYWQGMDTVRDRQLLESRWAAGNAPWKRWEG